MAISKLSSANLVLVGLSLMCQQEIVVGKVFVYRNSTNQLIEEFDDIPAQFGPSLPANDLRAFVGPHDSNNLYGCQNLRPPPRRDYPTKAKFVAIISRGGGCTFEDKVRVAQRATFDAVIIYFNEGDKLQALTAKNASGIHIPSVVVDMKTGQTLLTYNTSETVLVINEELPFNYTSQLILPYAILIGIFFFCCLCLCLYRYLYNKGRCILKRCHGITSESTRIEEQDIEEVVLIDESDNNNTVHSTGSKVNSKATSDRTSPLKKKRDYVAIEQSSEDESDVESKCSRNIKDLTEDIAWEKADYIGDRNL